MRPVLYSSHTLADFLRHRTVATMTELAAALGNPTRRTVVRKLAELPLLTSYSHAGRYHALGESARFDENGLWFVGSVRFSAHGTLRATARALVPRAPAGRFPQELDALLHVRCSDALRHLARLGLLARFQLAGRFLYCSAKPDRQQRQLQARRAALSPPPADQASDISTARHTFLGTLDERQRRLYAGLASLERGHGGDRHVAALTGLHPSTVARGRRELLAGDAGGGRVRRPGAGRPRAEKKPSRDRRAGGTARTRHRRRPL